MSGSFLDSNVIVYLFGDDLAKQERADVLIDEAIVDGGAISFQVVQEVLNVVSRKVQPSPTVEQTTALLDQVLMPLWHVAPSRALYERALEIHERYRYDFYDSLIISSALESGCTRLLSEDLQDGQRIEGLTIENPFRDLGNGRR